jgi:DNA-binding NtrC family response regulator
MPTIPPRRLVIAAGDPRIALTFGADLERTLQLTAPVLRFEELPEILSPETDGAVLVFALEPGDARRAEAVIREAKVRRVPAKFALVESEQVRGLRTLDFLSPHVEARWVWPTQTREMTAWAGTGPGAGTPFPDPAAETVAERFRRRLLNRTPALAGLVGQLCIAAAHDVTVLIEGESGTGKAELARLIHDASPRGRERFLAVDCGALASNQIGSELFGHAAGAFGGAEVAKVGALAAAGEGTVLLTEVDALSPDQQARILRVLETGEFEPVGTHESEKCRARIIATTNWTLADAVERGTFRRDLYYRLHVISLQLPPLRHRPEDVGPLVRDMLARYGTKFGKRLFGLCPEAQRALEAYPWPGNIRQLENVIQQAVLAGSGPELKAHHLPAAIGARAEPSDAASPIQPGYCGTLRQSRESSERANIIRALEKAGRSRTRAAQLLGVSRVTLYKKMKKYGLSSARPLHSPGPG